MLRQSVCCTLAILLLVMVLGSAFAQPAGDADPPPPPDPAGGQPGPGGMGPPGMDFPADVVMADGEAADPMKKAGPYLWIIAAIIAVVAIAAWAMSRKKQA